MMAGLGYEPYDSYEESNVQWIGKLPSHWKVERSKWLFSDRKERARRGEPQLAATQKYGVIPQSEFMEIEGRRVTQVFLDFDILKHVDAGDFVMSMRSFQGGIEYSAHTGCVSSAYVALRPKPNVEPAFFRYLLKSTRYIEALQSTSNLVRDGQALRFENFSSVDLFIVPIEEQRAIATFLNDKCAKIDGAVKIKEDQIALLRERRQIIIQDAVTRGLNPAAPMKDSGIDWIGQIPAHWDVKRLASFGSFSKGGGFSKSDLAETGTDAVLYGDIYTQYDFVIDNPVRKISKNVADQSVPLSQGDLLFTGSGETKEDIGKCVLFRGLAKAVSGGDVIIFRQSQNHPLFLTFCLNSHGVVEEKAKSSKGEIIVHTYGSALKNIYIPVPPLDEQAKIANWVWDGIGKIAAAISMKQDQIAALKEYKTSLINAAVTGKIKVI